MDQERAADLLEALRARRAWLLGTMMAHYDELNDLEAMMERLKAQLEPNAEP